MKSSYYNVDGNCYKHIQSIGINFKNMGVYIDESYDTEVSQNPGASAQGGRGGGRPSKKIGTGAAPPQTKNTERRRKMTKVHCAPPEALGAPRARHVIAL